MSRNGSKRKELSFPGSESAAALGRAPGRPRLVYARDDSMGGKSTPFRSARILIVEDDYLVASQMEAALSEAGFEPLPPVMSAEEGIELAGNSGAALAVIDISLGGRLDGIDGAVELFKAHGIRCVFATAYTDVSLRERAKAARPLGWLQKPYTMHSLVEIVRDALTRLRDKPE